MIGFTTEETLIKITHAIGIYNSLKNAGPSMEPCGTPHDTFIHSELVSLIYIDFYFRDSYIPIYLLSIIMIHCVKGLFLFSGQ